MPSLNYGDWKITAGKNKRPLCVTQNSPVMRIGSHGNFRMVEPSELCESFRASRRPVGLVVLKFFSPICLLFFLLNYR